MARRSRTDYSSGEIKDFIMSDTHYRLTRRKLGNGFVSVKLEAHAGEEYEFIVEVPRGAWNTSKIKKTVEIKRQPMNAEEH